MNWYVLPLTYLINANGRGGGGDAAKVAEGEEGDRESTITKCWTASGDKGGS